MGAVAFGALLFAVLLVVVAALVLQERRGMPSSEPAAYILPEAARFVWEAVDDDIAERLDIDDVTHLLEWSIQFNQIVLGRSNGGPHVIGADQAASYVLERSPGVDARDVAAVLAAEKQYLVSIGAVGEPVEGLES